MTTLLASLVVLLMAGCAGEAPTRIVQTGSNIVPSSTAQDLVTYGDVAVLFTVISESEIAPTSDEVKHGEGTITRQVTARQNGKAVWTRPTRDKLAPAPPSEWVISDGGWIFHDGDLSNRIRLEVGGRASLEVGQQYLAIRTYSSLGGETDPEWFSLTYVPINGGKVQFDAQSLRRSTSSSYEQGLQGASLSEVGNLLKATVPDPKAEPYMHLDAAHRYAKLFG